MSTKVTDDPSQQSHGRHAGLDAAPRRGQRSASPRSTLLFEDAHPEDDHPGVSRLYTVAMMADVLRAPRAAVRHWLARLRVSAAERRGDGVVLRAPARGLGEVLSGFCGAPGLAVTGHGACLPGAVPSAA